MKRIFLILTILSLFLILTYPAIAENKPIKIGIMGPMGDATGLNVLRPAELMIKKINAEGGLLGRQIEIVGPYDTKWEPAEGIRAFERLKAAKVDLILSGIVDDSEAGLLSRIAASDDIIYFSEFASTMTFMTNVKKKYNKFKNYFMFTPIDIGMYGCVEEPALMLSKQLGWKNVYLMREDSVWTEGVGEMVLNETPTHGLNVVGFDVIPIDAKDLTPYFRKAEKAGADMIYTFFSSFGEAAASQAWDIKLKIPMIGHNGVLNDYGYWKRSRGAWGPLITTSKWGSLEKHSAEWRDFMVEWSTSYDDDPRTPMWLGECTWKSIKAYKEAVERAGTTETDAVIKELENTYYPDAPTMGGFYGPDEGDWPHSWCIPIDEKARFEKNPKRGAGLWKPSNMIPLTQWQPKEIAPASTFLLPGTPDDYGRLVTIWPSHIAGGTFQYPPYYTEEDIKKLEHK
ncbi:MAG: ABC transporter substrate-binding protein [Desulfobacterales bacterium]|nr:ABC transporter substrate-binding protein [Desulfobacterales bacterium]